MPLGSHVAVAVAVVFRPAATALISPLAWEPPYATGVALKKTQKKASKHNFSRDIPDTTAAGTQWSSLAMGFTGSIYFYLEYAFPKLSTLRMCDFYHQI